MNAPGRPAVTLRPSGVTSIVAALGTVLVAGILAVAGAGLAPVVTAAFLVVAPAAAVAVPLRGFEPLARIVLALAAAAVVDALVAEAMLATGTWSIPGGVAAVGAISAVTWITISAVSGSFLAVAGAS